MADERDTGPTVPRSTDEENTAIDTTSAEPLRKAKIEDPDELDSLEEPDRPDEPNPPRTTRGNFTAPKFGSAGSGGAEFEPGPERD
ncbi:MAG TPA: hypothetical protein VK494_06745 [Gemmatimonadaceae bacterium]|nr:hypothetical protein [Gemmatimonadaceae bacterium]